MNIDIIRTEDGESKLKEIEDPEYVDVLVNVNEVAVDGEIYTDVTQVSFRKEKDE
jgi:hypothetical protein